MIRVISNLDAEALQLELNRLGPSFDIISIYAIQQKHFAWVRMKDPKPEKKGTKSL